MTASGENRRAGKGLVGAGAAACAVCCAPAILGFLGAVGAGLIGFLLIGVVAVIVAAVLLGWLWRRNHRSGCADPAPGPVPVDPPTVGRRS